MDVLAWTSTRFGYASKSFDAQRIVDDLRTMIQGMALREVDPADYSWVSGSGVIDTPPSIVPVTLPAQAVPGFALVGALIADASGRSRVAGIDAIWDAVGLDNVDGIEFEFRDDATNVVVARVTTSNIEAGRVTVTAGILPSTAYEGRARLVIDRPRSWTSWTPVTTPAAYIIESEIEPAVIADIMNAQVDATAAGAASAAVTANHNALVAGFTGDLATAFASAAQMAEAAGQGWLADPYFAEWTNATVLKANNWGEAGNPAYQSKMTTGYGGGVHTVIPAGAAYSHFVAVTLANDGLSNANPNAPAVTLTLEFELAAGSLTGQRLYPQWSTDAVTWVNGQRNGGTAANSFADRGIQVIPGVRQLIQEVWLKPAGTFAHMRLIYMPKVNTDTAAVDIKATLLNVRAATQAELDAYKTYAVASVTNGATNFVQGIGASLAQVSTSLNAQVGATNANLTTNYMTSASTTAAIAAMQTTLNASISRGDACFPQFNDVARTNWNTGPAVAANTMYGSGSDLTFTAGAAGTNTGIYLQSNAADWKGAKNPAAFLVELDATLISGGVQGASVLVDWFNTGGTSWRASMKLADMIGYTPIAGLPLRASGIFARPAGFTGTFASHVVYFLANSTVMEPGLAKVLKLHRFAMYPADATDTLTRSLNSSVTNILAVDVSALTGTAMGVLLTQLAVSGGGTSATITAQGSAIADLSGNASALYGFSVGAGGVSAGLQLCAYYDADTGVAASNVKINADWIDLVGKVRASSLLVSAPDNAWPDYDMVDPAMYATSTAASYVFVPVSVNKLGKCVLQIAVDAALEIVTSRSFPVEAEEQYRVSGGAWLVAAGAGGGQAVLDLQTLSVDASGVETLVRTITISDNTDLGLGGIIMGRVDVVMAANEVRARWRFRRIAGGTQAARFGGLKAKQMTGADLLVSGALSVQGMAAFGGSLQSSNFVTGVSGWKLTNAGVFEGKDVILRDALAGGSVTDVYSTLVSVAQDHPSTAAGVITYATLTIPAQDSLAILKRAVSFEARLVSGGGTVEVSLEARFDTGAGYGAWALIESWSIPNSTVWEWFRDSGNLSGPYDSVQYRLTGLRSVAGGAPAVSGIRNISLRASNQVK